MKTAILCAVALAAAALSSAHATESHRVKGYVKKDGTYVAPHQQTNPNSTKTDNWSSKPNTNPYTGTTGTVDPYKAPAAPKKK